MAGFISQELQAGGIQVDPLSGGELRGIVPTHRLTRDEEIVLRDYEEIAFCASALCTALESEPTSIWRRSLGFTVQFLEPEDQELWAITTRPQSDKIHIATQNTEAVEGRLMRTGVAWELDAADQQDMDKIAFGLMAVRSHALQRKLGAEVSPVISEDVDSKRSLNLCRLLPLFPRHK